MLRRFAHRIETSRLVVRAYEPSDAAALKEGIDESLERLRPWLPFARDEPEPVAAKAERIATWAEQFGHGEDLMYGIFDRRSGRFLGSIGLHDRVGEGGREIGYWLRTSATGSGYATEAAAALTRAGIEIGGLERMEIRVDAANAPSLAVPRRLGYVETVRIREPGPDGEGELDLVVHTLAAAAYPMSAAARVPAAAFAADGRPLPVALPFDAAEA